MEKEQLIYVIGQSGEILAVKKTKKPTPEAMLRLQKETAEKGLKPEAEKIN